MTTKKTTTRSHGGGAAARLALPAVAGLALVLPFVLLELGNRRGLDEPFPFALFGFLWLLPAAFVLVVAPIVRSALAGAPLLERPGGLVLRVVCLAALASAWGAIVLDQLPCFLGLASCD
jgi:hypothetical protein